jgi:hypothetical protein
LLAGVCREDASGTLERGGHDATRQEHSTVHDQFDVSLEDADLLGEVELTTNLIIAASESDDHLSTGEIDEILGVDEETRQAG